MEKSEWDRLQALFEGALELPAEQRDAYLQQQAGSNSMLREVRDLLDAHFNATNLWQSSPANPTRIPAGLGHVGLLEIGHAIGPLQIQEKIGAGGMGVIYRALDTRLQRQVALKFLSNHLYRDDMARRRFMAEARAASRLDHPNICVVHDIGETEEGHMYISMPFYAGETLATRIVRGPFPANDAIDIGIQVSDGLANAHGHDIVHRDIKPANIMLTPDGLVKILDFGIAKVANDNLTRPGLGMGIGTLAYMAPEQLKGEQVDARADIWAVGTVLYEMLCGRPAFPGKELQQIPKAVLDEHYDPLASLPGGVSRELRVVLRNAMQRNRDARYADIGQMLDDLCRARRSISGADAAAHEDASTKIRPKRAGYDWDADFLDALIIILLPRMGPITPKLVHRYAKASPTLDSLLQCLDDGLPDDAARRFLTRQIKMKAAMYSSAPAPRPVTNDDEENDFEPSPAQLAMLIGKLLPELGPIAAIVIRRAAAHATDWESLCQQLSQYFHNKEDANDFLGDIFVEGNQ